MSRKKAGVSIFAGKTLDENIAEDLLSGGDQYTQRLISTYFLNLLKNTDVASPVAYRICHAFAANVSEFDELETWAELGTFEQFSKKYPLKAKPKPKSVAKKDWEALIHYFEDRVKGFEGVDALPTTHKNIAVVGQRLGLSDTEIDVLTYLHVYASSSELSEFTGDFLSADKVKIAPSVARFINRPGEISQIVNVLSPLGSLSKFGLLSDFSQDEGILFMPVIDQDIEMSLSDPQMTGDNILEIIIGKPSKTDLSVDDFPYLSSHIKEIQNIIRAAVQRGETGINILLHGPAGSGKTALAQAIAQSLDLPLFSIGEDDDGSRENGTTSQHRIGKLFLAGELLKGKKGLLFFDEIEDLLLKGTDSDKKSDTHSKIVVNRLLENNAVVTIWAGNDPGKFHESMRQRFAYSVYVDYPPTPMRKRILVRHLELNKSKMEPGDVSYLAREYMAPPRMTANAIRHVSMTTAPDNPLDVKRVENIMAASSQLTYGDSQAIKSRGGVSSKFDIDLFNYETLYQNEMAAVIDAGHKTAPYAIFLQGLPGTGMKNFGRFMAEKAVVNQAEYDMRAIVEKSPLQSPETKLIGAFEQARDNKHLLVFSNMDALSLNPDSTSGGWKDGLAPLFMEQMVRHPLPIIAHSYRPGAAFPDFMKDAFSLSSRVNPLSDAQCRKAYQLYFGEAAAQDMRFPADLVPADFANVHKILQRSTNGHTSATRIHEFLEKQPHYRDAGHGVGFGR